MKKKIRDIIIYDVILRNSSFFTKTEIILLQYFINQAFTFNNDVVWYKVDKILNDCDFYETYLYRALKRLKEKNIIDIITLTNEEKKKNKINTSKAVVINFNYDEWNIKIK